jgi:hypothetical protein
MKAWIAKIGQSIQFVAFWAHLGVAGLLIVLINKLLSKRPAEILALVIIVAGGVKEYYFDATTEQNPPQTFWDNTEDFIGWCVGSLVGFLLIH